MTAPVMQGWVWRNGVAAFMALPVPPQSHFLAFALASGAAAIIVAGFDFVPVLDHINLAFHEAGHPIFGLFGELMGWLGGTLFQFVFPLATTVHFLRRAQILSAAACLLWLFENLRYVAAYLGDARAQALPLVGGGEHDWAYLLGRWGLLEYDQRIARMLVFISWSGWVLVWLALAGWWWHGRRAAEQLAKMQRRQQIIEEARQREQTRQAQRREQP